MTSRFAIRRGRRLPGSKFAMVPAVTCIDWQIPDCCRHGYSPNSDTVLLDRRRVAREIRREYESIAADIKQLDNRWLS